MREVVVNQYLGCPFLFCHITHLPAALSINARYQPQAVKSNRARSLNSQRVSNLAFSSVILIVPRVLL